MIQIAESTKMERAIKHLLISIDPKAFTSEGVIHSYTLIKVNWNTIQWEG